MSEPTIPTLPDGIVFTTVAERFGWNLRIARQRAGLTQQELGDRIGGSQPKIAGWEGGSCCPKVASLVQLAEVLDIDPGELLRETRGLAS
jgi:transcriptional regulator with XRE-family HTH domain